MHFLFVVARKDTITIHTHAGCFTISYFFWRKGASRDSYSGRLEQTNLPQQAPSRSECLTVAGRLLR
jgi:hypothetical protein